MRDAVDVNTGPDHPWHVRLAFWLIGWLVR